MIMRFQQSIVCLARRAVFLMTTIVLAACLQWPARAHDTWLETNSNLIRAGEVVHIDLKLGNHGNHHRDFLLAGRLPADWVNMEVMSSPGVKESLRDRLTPTAAAEKEGYWTTAYTPRTPGVYTVVQSLDRVMKHGQTVRGVRSAKTLFVASESLDEPRCDASASLAPVGLPFELVLTTCPLRDMAVGRPLEVRVFKGGKPRADVVVGFIPRGEKLADEFDSQFERRTDAEGLASFTPKRATVYLVTARLNAPEEKSDEYMSTNYAATFTLHVPNSPLLRK